MSEPTEGPTCDHCGEPTDRRDPVTDQPCCQDCDRSEDGPMGGMGHGASYDCSHTYGGGDCDR